MGVFRDHVSTGPATTESLRSCLRKLREGGSVEVHERVDLRAWSRLRVGGTGDLLLRCRTATAVASVLDALACHGISWLVIGGGTALVLPDAGLRVPLLRLSGELASFELDLDGVVVGAGAPLEQVERAACRSGLAGLEALRGPGSLGGALRAEATAGRSGLMSRVEWVDMLRPGEEVRRLWPRRTPPSLMDGSAGDARAVLLAARISLQPSRPSAVASSRGGGSGEGFPAARGRVRIFRDPEGGGATELLRQAGCEMVTIGGARTDPADPNHLLTTRLASAADVAGLCDALRDRVERACGVRLEPRLRFVDPEGRLVAS
jgi:UDP-N-acetylmuramate dehydrogenase